MSNPEVILLKSHNPDFHSDKMFSWLIGLMVEAGVHFAFDENFELPSDLPDDLTGCKLILMRADDEAHYREKLGARFEEFVRNNGKVTVLDALDAAQVKEYHPLYRLFSIAMTEPGITFNHPEFRAFMRRRRFEEVFKWGRDGVINRLEATEARGAPDWNEPHTFGVLQPFQALAELYPDDLWLDRLRRHLDWVMEKNPGMPTNSIHGMTTFHFMTEKTGDATYADWACARTREAMDAMEPRHGTIQTLSRRGRLLWNEGLANVCPAASALSARTGDPEPLATVVKLARAVHEFNIAPVLKLWYHAGTPSYHTPVIWGRGQAWALIGLIGMAEHMPRDHEAFPEIQGYIAEILEGLSRSQDAEGLWGNVMDEPKSRRALRACGMFVHCFARVKRFGILDSDLLDDVVRKAWVGVRGRMWPNSLCCICGGSGPGTYTYYTTRPFTPMGFAEAAGAGAEVMLAYGDDDF